MEGEDPALLLRQHLLLLQSRDDTLERVVEIALRECRVAAAAGEDRRLVADVGELGAGEAARLARDLRQVDAVRERLPARVHTENRFAALQVGRRHEHLTVEAPGAEQRLIEILDAVRRAHDDDLLGAFEPVELDEQLVQRLILLAVETVPGALRADGIELVDEDDRRRMLARLEEELADSRGAEAGEHLDEGRGARRVEVRAGLVRDGLGEEGLAGAGRPVEEKALRHLRAEPLEALRVTEEVDDLHQLAANLLDPGDVVPGHARLRAGVDVRRSHARHHPDGLPEEPRRQDEDREEGQRQPRGGEVGQRMEPVPHHLDLLIGSRDGSLSRGRPPPPRPS